MSRKPLVSFILIAYKQERFIRESVRSALAQTYEPLEIILSDDASPDRTFEIMQEETGAYYGSHTITLNRNPRNVGLSCNFNRAYSLTNGELIVVQGGDDVSFPNRTQVLQQAWIDPTSVDLVFSNAMVIDADGAAVKDRWFQSPFDASSLCAQDVFQGHGIGVLGCSTAFSRSLFEKYGELNSLVSAEDTVLAFRALLNRGIRYVDQVLVNYRVHEGNLVLGRNHWRTKDRARAERESEGRLAIVQDCLRAYDLSCTADRNLRRTLETHQRQHAYDVACYGKSRVESMLLVIEGLCKGVPPRKVAGLIKRHVLGRK